MLPKGLSQLRVAACNNGVIGFYTEFNAKQLFKKGLTFLRENTNPKQKIHRL